MSQLEISGTSNITWVENLTRGAIAVLLHPFLPLKETGFDYNCLFSKQRYCIVQSRCNLKFGHQGHIEDLNKQNSDHLHVPKFIFERFQNWTVSNSETRADSTGLLNNIESYLSQFHVYLRNYASKTKPKYLLLAGQLILCNCLLTYYLIEDIRKVYQYISNYRRKSRLP